MNLSEIKVPTWLSVHRHAEEIMDRIDPIPTAMLPPPGSELPQLPAQPKSPEDEAVEKAAATMAKIKQERQEQAETIERLTKENKSLRGEMGWRDLRIAQLENDLATSQSQCETLRQDNSDLRALQTEQHALCKHLVARYENFEIPLPVRKRVRNGKTNEASHALPEKPIDRPTIQPDQAA